MVKAEDQLVFFEVFSHVDWIDHKNHRKHAVHEAEQRGDHRVLDVCPLY